MTETEILSFNILSHIRGEVDGLREDMCEVKERLGHIGGKLRFRLALRRSY
jgi:hypothetical protein